MKRSVFATVAAALLVAGIGVACIPAPPQNGTVVEEFVIHPTATLGGVSPGHSFMNLPFDIRCDAGSEVAVGAAARQVRTGGGIGIIHHLACTGTLQNLTMHIVSDPTKAPLQLGAAHVTMKVTLLTSPSLPTETFEADITVQ